MPTFLQHQNNRHNQHRRGTCNQQHLHRSQIRQRQLEGGGNRRPEQNRTQPVKHGCFLIFHYTSPRGSFVLAVIEEVSSLIVSPPYSPAANQRYKVRRLIPKIWAARRLLPFTACITSRT